VKLQSGAYTAVVAAPAVALKIDTCKTEYSAVSGPAGSSSQWFGLRRVNSALIRLGTANAKPPQTVWQATKNNGKTALNENSTRPAF
jgi:hypothetical protein